jgi:hypothetical protein
LYALYIGHEAYARSLEARDAALGLFRSTSETVSALTTTPAATAFDVLAADDTAIAAGRDVTATNDA